MKMLCAVLVLAVLGFGAFGAQLAVDAKSDDAGAVQGEVKIVWGAKVQTIAERAALIEIGNEAKRAALDAEWERSHVGGKALIAVRRGGWVAIVGGLLAAIAEHNDWFSSSSKSSEPERPTYYVDGNMYNLTYGDNSGNDSAINFGTQAPVAEE